MSGLPNINNSSQQENLIPQKILTDFENSLTVETIQNLSKKFEQFEKSGIITHKKSISIMTETFCTGILNNTAVQKYQTLFELIFNRFLKRNYNVRNTQENYYVTKMSTEDNISIYEVCCALTVFIKIEFIEKIRLLFNLTDIDGDGYVNEKEIIKLMMTLNLIYSKEETPIDTDSTILNQSLINIKNNQNLNLLFYNPGGLKTILDNELCVNFDTFYNSLIKIPGYKFKIFPSFLNLLDALRDELKEKKIVIKRSYKDDFIKIANEIVSPVNEIYNHYGEKALFTKRKKIQSFRGRESISVRGGIINMSNDNKGLTNIMSPQPRTRRYEYVVNVNKVINMEAKPFIINIEDGGNMKQKNLAQSQDNKIFSKRKSILSKRLMLNRLGVGLLSRKSVLGLQPKPTNTQPGYQTLEEMIEEVTAINNKHKGDYAYERDLIAVEVKCEEKGEEMKKYFSSKNRLRTNLVFGKFDFKNKKNNNIRYNL